MSLAIDLDEMRAVIKSPKSPKREQITEDIENKFYCLGDKKRWVYIPDNDQLFELSEYLGFNLLEYYQDYYGGITEVVPIIIKCDYRLSLGGRSQYNQIDFLSQMMGGGSFDEDRKKSVTLEAFMNPDDHIEQFI